MIITMIVMVNIFKTPVWASFFYFVSFFILVYFFCKMHVTFFNCIFACYIAQRILWHFVCHAEVCFVPVLRSRNACGIVCATARSSLLVRLAT